MSRDISEYRDREAEAATLAAALCDPLAAAEVMEVVTPPMFYSEAAQVLYSAIEGVSANGSDPDMVTVCSWLEARGLIDKAGGHVHISGLLDRMPSVANAKHYAEIVREKHSAREMYRVAQSIMSKSTAPEMLEAAQSGLDSLSMFNGGESLTHISPVAEAVIEEARELQAGKKENVGLSTGLAVIDKWLYSLQPGDLVILAARPAVGKTSLALHMATNMAINQRSGVLFASLEMTAEKLTRRILANISGIRASSFQDGNFEMKEFPSDFELIEDAKARLDSSNFYIDDKSDTTIISLRAVARKLQRQGKLDVIFVDYLQLMEGPGGYGYKQVTEFSRGLKRIAKDLNVPVVALAQLRRPPEEGGSEKRPRLTDLKESGSIEQDADIVMFIVRDMAEKPDVAQVQVAKHRDGPIGDAPVRFDSTNGRWTNGEWSDFLVD